MKSTNSGPKPAQEAPASQLIDARIDELGASLDDPAGLFNASLDGNTRRAIDFHEGDAIDERALKALIVAAVRLNLQMAK